MSKHTPGPWVVEEDSVVNREFEGDEWCICEVYGLSSIADANRSLISTAPDLLRLLKWALPEIESLLRQQLSDGGVGLTEDFNRLYEAKELIERLGEA